MSHYKLGEILAISTATCFLTACAVQGGPFSGTNALVKCHGVNTCKGLTECKGANNACKARNSCKGIGWVAITKEQCETRTDKLKNN